MDDDKRQLKPIYIVGAGGAAKEVFLLVQQINTYQPVFDFKGFIDFNPDSDYFYVGGEKYDCIEEDTFLKKTTENVAIAFGIGDPLKMSKISNLYKSKNNFYFPNLIHPDVTLHNSIVLGVGNIISEACVITIDISIDSFNYINRGVQIGHDSIIGSNNVINPGAIISGGVNISDTNLIGTNATILQYLSVGSNNKIGAGAVLTKSVENNKLMVGIPAKKIDK